MKKILSLLALALVSIGLVWADEVSEPESKAAEVTYQSFDKETIYPLTADNIKAAQDAGWMEGAATTNTKASTIDPATGEELEKSANYPCVTVKKGNGNKTLKVYVTGLSSFTAYGATQGGTDRDILVTATPESGDAISARLTSKNYTSVAVEVKLDPSVKYTIDITGTDPGAEGGADCAVHSLKFVPGEAAEGAVTLFSWEGAKDGAKVEGGKVAGNGADASNVTDETIIVSSKKANIATDNVTLTFDEPLQAGDKLSITGYRSKENDAVGTLYIAFENGTAIDEGEENVWNNIHANYNQEPNTREFVVPEDAAGSKYIRLARSKSGTNVFITKIVITGARDMSDPDKDLTFDAYTSLDFNSAVNGAVSRGGRHAGDITAANGYDKTNPLVITADNAILTITPNSATGNYPEGSEPCSKFIETVAGPQLVLSGGYAGATLKLEAKGASAVPFQQINFKQTNWSKNITVDKGSFDPATGIWTSTVNTAITELTFTIKADTTWVCESKFKPADPKKPDGDQVYDGYDIVEVVLHDMGIWKINKILINPSEAIDEKVAAGTELSSFVAEKIAELKKDDINPKYVKLELEAGKNYTVTNAIEVGCPLTIIGNGAIIDATASEEPFVQMSANPTADFIGTQNYYGVDQVKFENINVANLKNSIFYDNKKKYCVIDFTIDGCVFQLNTEKVEQDSYIAFYTGGIKDFTVKNSTFYGNRKAARWFIRYNNSSRLDRYGFTGSDDTWSMTYENNTFYGLLRTENSNGDDDAQWGNYSGITSSNYNKKLIVTVNKNIWYDCDAQTMRRLLNSKAFTTSNFHPNSTMDANTFLRNGSPVDQGTYGNSTDLTTDPGFADAAKGDFTLSTTSAQYTNQTGDPRWFDGTGKALAIEGSGSGAITGIEAVKEAKTAEDGAWYTIQGQRVAQPTKGLYIHNGKKVVIK